MIRTQIQIGEAQAKALRRLAAERGVSVAALVREGIEVLLEQTKRHEGWEEALQVVGRFRGPGGEGARQHDRYLEEAYRE
jgi:Arc/MetJ-type ribon-helix-helix transcriptional regulator